jgi:hypothetical protein
VCSANSFLVCFKANDHMEVAISMQSSDNGGFGPHGGMGVSLVHDLRCRCPVAEDG